MCMWCRREDFLSKTIKHVFFLFQMCSFSYLGVLLSSALLRGLHLFIHLIRGEAGSLGSTAWQCRPGALQKFSGTASIVLLKQEGAVSLLVPHRVIAQEGRKQPFLRVVCMPSDATAFHWNPHTGILWSRDSDLHFADEYTESWKGWLMKPASYSKRLQSSCSDSGLYTSELCPVHYLFVSFKRQCYSASPHFHEVWCFLSCIPW